MVQKILSFGTAAGLVIGSILFGLTVGMKNHPPLAYGMLIGYLTMLLGLSAVFVAIKKHRDADLGGVIRFWPALGLGLGVSLVASLFYVAAWEAALAVTQMDLAGSYADALMAEQRTRGASAEALAKLAVEMETFKVEYANPLIRLPMTLTEIFPVGVLVSLVSAGLLRSPRFLPARQA